MRGASQFLLVLGEPVVLKGYWRVVEVYPSGMLLVLGSMLVVWLLKNEVAPYSLEVLQSSVPHGRKVVPVGNQMSVMTPVLKRVDKSERPTYAEIVGNSRK